ncbi:hypothetical protein FRC02_005952 [Tulasnella sp. 418]|nr:hypothetical protein FRC02_005952 [Tulasnella sp. 418]
MWISALFLFLLAPWAVYAQISMESFEYSLGVGRMVIKVEPNAPPTFAVNLTLGEETTRLLRRIPGDGTMNVQLRDGIPSEAGPLDIPVPSTVAPGPGYRMKLVSDQPNDDTTYFTSPQFSIQEGDFASLTGSASSPATSTADASGGAQSPVISTSSSVVVFTTNGVATTVVSAVPVTAGPATTTAATTAASSASKIFTPILSVIILPFIGAFLVLGN